MKAGPVEVVESKGIKIPVYSSPAFGKESYIIAYYAEGKRKRQRAGTLEEARSQAKAKIKELTAGTAHIGTFTPRQLAVVTDAAEILKAVGVPLSQVAREYAEAHKILAETGSIVEAAKAYARDAARRKMPRKAVSEVVKEFLAYVETTGLSRQYLRDCRARMERAASAFRTNIKDVTDQDIEAWLSKGDRSPRTYNNDRNSLVTLFRFAKRKGYLPREVETAPELVPKRKDVGGEIKILTPANYALLMANTPETFLPYVAIGGLAGLRTAEICRLDWREIDFQQGHILVTAKKSKTASRRIVPMCDALRKWLHPLARSEGKVMPYANEQSMVNRWSELKARMVTQAGKPIVDVPTNALRHSYGSYRLAQIEDAAKVSLEMGNSPRKLFQNYRQLVTKAQAHLWFSVMPTQSGKIVGIKVA